MNPDFITSFLILVGLCGFPLAIPMIFGVLILKDSWRDDVSRMTGFLTLKTVTAFLVILHFYGIPVNNLGIVFPFALYTFATLSIIYYFRDVLKRNRTAGLLLFGDFICWLAVFILLMLWNNLGVTIFAAFLPTVYATLSLIYVYRRSDLLKRV